MFIECLNLSLSNRCNASCLWCPETRGTKYNFDMPFDTVKKIIDEVSDPNFPSEIKMIHLSENGEALYNKDFLEITRYIKQKLPNVSVNLLSNFGLMTAEIARTLLTEKLISSCQLNIDGHDDESYRAVKGISYKSVIKNLKSFLDIRDEVNPVFDITINAMPAFEYFTTVRAFFNTNPDNTGDTVPYSDFDLVLESLKDIVPQNVSIKHSKSGFWAERKLIISGRANINVKLDTLDCPMIYRVEHEAFISPNGDWYPCCLDDNQDIILGNIVTNSLIEVANSETRATFVEKLKARKFEEIGYPCNTVICCQTVSIKEVEYKSMTKQFKKGDVIRIKQV